MQFLPECRLLTRRPTHQPAHAQVIVLEDRPEYIARASPQRAAAMQRAPFSVLAVCNPSLRAAGSEGARFFEGCLSIPGYQARALVDCRLLWLC